MIPLLCRVINVISLGEHVDDSNKKLGKCAQENWRRLRGFKRLAQVITGVKFKDGTEVKTVAQVAA